MKGMYRVALMMGLMAVSAVSTQAAEVRTHENDESKTEVYVVNNYLSAVRVFAEDAGGKLHSLGRVARGSLKTFDLPEAVASGEFRIKVYPSTPVWSPIPDDFGVKTNSLDSQRDHQVRFWLEADLTQSIVEIDRS